MAVKFGMRLDEACSLDPVPRRAFLYVMHLSEGGSVDWNTGKMREK